MRAQLHNLPLQVIPPSSLFHFLRKSQISVSVCFPGIQAPNNESRDREKKKKTRCGHVGKNKKKKWEGKKSEEGAFAERKA